jgi:hypothetical protein
VVQLEDAELAGTFDALGEADRLRETKRWRDEQIRSREEAIAMTFTQQDEGWIDAGEMEVDLSSMTPNAEAVLQQPGGGNFADMAHATSTSEQLEAQGNSDAQNRMLQVVSFQQEQWWRLLNLQQAEITAMNLRHQWKEALAAECRARDELRRVTCAADFPEMQHFLPQPPPLPAAATETNGTEADTQTSPPCDVAAEHELLAEHQRSELERLRQLHIAILTEMDAGSAGVGAVLKATGDEGEETLGETRAGPETGVGLGVDAGAGSEVQAGAAAADAAGGEQAEDDAQAADAATRATGLSDVAMPTTSLAASSDNRGPEGLTTNAVSDPGTHDTMPHDAAMQYNMALSQASLASMGGMPTFQQQLDLSNMNNMNMLALSGANMWQLPGSAALSATAMMSPAAAAWQWQPQSVGSAGPAFMPNAGFGSLYGGAMDPYGYFSVSAAPPVTAEIGLSREEPIEVDEAHPPKRSKMQEEQD